MTTLAKAWTPLWIEQCQHVVAWNEMMTKTSNNMCLFIRKVKSNIFNNGSKNILNIMNISIESIGWPQIQYVKPQARGWGQPNLMYNAIKNMLEAIWNERMIRCVKSYAPKLEIAHDFKWMWQGSKVLSKKILKIVCSCNHYHMFS